MSQTPRAPRPSTDLDFQQQLTDPFISSEYIDPSFTDKFKEYEIVRDENGEPIILEDGRVQVQITKDLWGVLQMFTRDWRLGNVNKEEAMAIQHHLHLTSDILICLGDDFKEPALMCFQRALCLNEVSQSKGGFVRKILNTFIHKSTAIDSDNKQQKRSFFGLGSKKNI